MTRRGRAIDNHAYRRIAAAGLAPRLAPLPASAPFPRSFHDNPRTHPGLVRTLALRASSAVSLFIPSHRPDFQFQCQLIGLGPLPMSWLPIDHTVLRASTTWLAGEIFPGAFVTLATVRLPFASDSLRQGRSRPRLKAASSGSCRASARSASEPPSAPGTSFSCIGRGRS